MAKTTVFLFINVDWFARSHFETYIITLANKCDLTLFSEDTGLLTGFSDTCQIVHLPGGRRNGIISTFISLLIVLRFFLFQRPDIVELVSIKPILLWSSLSKIFCIRRVCYITGLGTLFADINSKRSLLTFFLWFSLSGNAAIIFENSTNAEILSILSLRNRSVILNGVGVSPDCLPCLNFVKSTIFRRIDTTPFKVIMASRLLRDKGIFEFFDAAQILYQKVGKEILFCLAGSLDPFNPTSLTDLQLKHLLATAPNVQYLGHLPRLTDTLPEFNVFLFPSYHEGFPKCLVEASISGLPIITTNVAGCRDVVRLCSNGILVPPRDSAAIVESILNLYDNPELQLTLSFNSFTNSLPLFDASSISYQHISFLLS